MLLLPLRNRVTPPLTLALLALSASCVGRQEQRREFPHDQSGLATLAIGEYQAPAGAPAWSSLRLKITQLSPSPSKAEKSYASSAFSSGKLAERSFQVTYGLYNFQLEYLGQDATILYHSCPGEELVAHDIKTPKYEFAIKICAINHNNEPPSSPPPSSVVAVEPVAEVTIVPSPQTISPAEPRPGNAAGAKDIKFWVDPDSEAMRDALSLARSDDSAARQLRYISSTPMAVWYTEWKEDMAAVVRQHASAAEKQGATLVMVPYLIPSRDCGQHSQGGVESARYRTWIDQVATGIGETKAMIVLEPDALPMIDDLRDGRPCLDAQQKEERLSLMRYAVTTLKRNTNTRVYLDGGHSAWKSVDFMVDILGRAGIEMADGFALNVSSYQTNEASVQYGKAISQRLMGKPFVIDTSRNGRGPAEGNEWCNPAGRALGRAPTANTGTPGVDAYLWVKRPGESDGTCNGGPAAGQWWRERALELAGNAGIN